MHSLDKDEKQSPKSPPLSAPPHVNGTRPDPDSGLIDLKKLADGEMSTSMNNIEKQKEEREAAILASTSAVSLSQIVLPIAGREGKTPHDSEKLTPAGAAAAPAPAKSSRAGLVAVIAIGLLGAAAAAFWYIKQSEKGKEPEADGVAAGQTQTTAPVQPTIDKVGGAVEDTTGVKLPPLP